MVIAAMVVEEPRLATDIDVDEVQRTMSMRRNRA